MSVATSISNVANMERWPPSLGEQEASQTTISPPESIVASTQSSPRDLSPISAHFNHIDSLDTEPMLQSDTYNAEHEYKRLQEKLEWLAKEIQLKKDKEQLIIIESEILKLEEEKESFIAELVPLELQLVELKEQHQAKEVEFEKLEADLTELIAQADLSKSSCDYIKAHKAELTLLAAKPAIVQSRIELLQSAASIHERRETGQSKFQKKLEEVKILANEHELALSRLELEYERSKADWAFKWSIYGSGDKNDTLDSIKSPSEAANELVKKLTSEIEQTGIADLRETTGNVANVTSNGTCDAFQKEIQGLKEQITQMKPLYWVGYHVRVRKMILEASSQKGYRPDRKVLHAGYEVTSLGRSVADATLFLDFSPKKIAHSSDFLNAYGVSAAVAWEHRNFNFFQNVLSSKIEMRRTRLTYSDDKYNELSDNFVSQILEFKITSDEEVKNNPDLFDLYQKLREESQAAEQADKDRHNNRTARAFLSRYG